MTDRTTELLEQYLDGDYQIFPMAPNKAKRKDITALEEKFEISFPKEYVAHLLGENDNILGNRGIYIEVKEEIWPRPKLYDIGPFWTFLYGLHSYTAFAESEDWMRLDFAAKEFTDRTAIKGVPVLKIIGDADFYCLDAQGRIGRYNHELNEIENTEDNFWAILEEELKQLSERKARKLELNKKIKKAK